MKHKYFHIKTLFVLLFGTLSLHSQVNQAWVSRFELSASDIAVSIAVDKSGNVFVGGYSFTTNQNYDYAVVKYNSSGTQQWYAKYNGPGNDVDFGRSIGIDTLGNVYITGSSRRGSVGTEDYATIKYNANGVEQWIARYDGPASGADVGYAMVVDENGNSYVTGFSMSLTSDFDYYTIKYNTSGDTVWTARYNGTGNSLDEAYAIARDYQGNIIITGASRNSSESGSEDIVTIKYNPSGVQQWTARYDGPAANIDAGQAICTDANGNIYVTGNSVNSSGTYSDFCTIKYSASGVQQWVSRYQHPASGYGQANSIAVDNSGNVLITGSSPGPGTSNDYCTIKYNSAGVQQWVSRYNGPGNAFDNPHTVAVDQSGNIYVSGGSNGIGSNFDYALIKYNTNGDTLWIQRYNGPANSYDVSYAMCLDSYNNIYVTGQSTGLSTGDDFATIKYSQPTGIIKINNEIPSRFLLLQNFPNPFNPSTKINYELPATKFVKLTIFDNLGRKIESLVNESQQPGKYEVVFDGTKYPSGVYFYELKTDGYTETKKMILLK